MQTTKAAIPDVVYSYLFFICAVAVTLTLAMIAVMAVQCVIYNGMPALARYLKNIIRK
jgi:hypothetical protein